jgi:hypothetical protein
MKDCSIGVDFKEKGSNAAYTSPPFMNSCFMLMKFWGRVDNLRIDIYSGTSL